MYQQCPTTINDIHLLLHRRRIAGIATSRRIATSGRIAASRRITTSRRIATSGRIATSRRIATSGRITTSGRIATSRRIATGGRIARHRRTVATHRSHHRATTVDTRGSGDGLRRGHAHAVDGDDQVDRATSLAAREVDQRLSEVVPLINAAHGEDLADGDHADTKSIVGGETIPIENLHLKHISHGGGAVEGELLVPDGRECVADDLGLAHVALAEVADGGQQIGGLVHDAELSEGIALAASISSGQAAGLNDTNSDTAHCTLLSNR